MSTDRFLEEDDAFYRPVTSDSDPANTIGAHSPPGSGLGDTQDPLAHMSEEEKQRQREEWQEELQKTEEEINTLRQVLSSKVRHMNELKQQLGISPLVEMKQDLQHGLDNLRSTDAYQKTANVVRVARDKTSATLQTASTKATEKWSVWRNSNAFKSFEDKVGTVYSGMKFSKSVGRLTHFQHRHADDESKIASSMQGPTSQQQAPGTTDGSAASGGSPAGSVPSNTNPPQA